MDLTTVAAVKAWLGIPNGEILEVKVTAGGTGFHPETTTISLSGVIGPGTDFDSVPVIVGGVVQSIAILNPGKSYLKETPPTVVFTDTDVSPGSGAQASLTIAPIDGSADALLARLISAASSFFFQRCSRFVLIGPASITETRDGHQGQRRIVTLESPVSAVSSLKIDGTAVQLSSGPLAPGFGFDTDGVFLRGMAFTEGYSNVEIGYTAGFAADSPEAAVIEQAVIELVAYKYRSRKHEGEVSQSLGGGATQTISYSFTQKDVTPGIQTIINKFSRPMVFG